MKRWKVKLKFAVVTLIISAMGIPTFAAVNSGHTLVPYVDAEDYSIHTLEQVKKETGISRYNIGFMAANKDNELVWYEDRLTREAKDLEKDVKETLKAIRNQGSDAMISFGVPTMLEEERETHYKPLYEVENRVANLVESYKEVIDTYQLTAADFYMAGTTFSNSQEDAIENQLDALIKLKEKSPSLELWMTFEVDDRGASDDVLDFIDYAIEKGLQFKGINFVLEDYTLQTVNKNKEYVSQTTIRTLNTIYGQLEGIYKSHNKTINIWEVMGITSLINDDFQKEDAKEIALFAKEKHLGLVSYYKLEQDTNLIYAKAYADKVVDIQIPTGIPSYRGDWKPSTNYVTGDLVVYNQKMYTCMIGHLSVEDWQPVATPAIWNRVPGEISELKDLTNLKDLLNGNEKKWALQVAYKIGDIVYYEGNKYTCIQGHTAHAEHYNPKLAPSLWGIVKEQTPNNLPR